MPRRRFELFGVPVDAVTLEAAVEAVARMVTSKTCGQHASVNAAKLVRLQRDATLREAIWSCGLVTADGQSVVWASRLLGRPLPERVAGIDLMERLVAVSEDRAFRIYLLGARPHVLDAAAAELRRRHPQLKIAGKHHGYFSADEEPSVVGEIASARPDMLFIALETPRKELFLTRHRETLRIPFAMGVGGALDVLAGRRKRAPRWAREIGLEWLFRLAQEPRRLAGRYVLGNARFVALVARTVVRERRGGISTPAEGP